MAIKVTLNQDALNQFAEQAAQRVVAASQDDWLALCGELKGSPVEEIERRVHGFFGGNATVTGEMASMIQRGERVELRGGKVGS